MMNDDISVFPSKLLVHSCICLYRFKNLKVKYTIIELGIPKSNLIVLFVKDMYKKDYLDI